MDVSGEARLLADPGGRLIGLVQVLRRLHAERSDAVLVGGLAVLGRVTAAYRVTDDVDHVTGPDSDLLTLLDLHGSRRGASWVVDGVKVDVIEVGATPAEQVRAEAWPDELAAKLFALSHQWAYDTATPMTIEVWEDQGSMMAAAMVRAATTPALCAMKLQSAPRRAAARRYKAGSDYLDLYRLLATATDFDAVIGDLREAPADLGAWALAELHHRFDDEAERTVRTIRAATNLPPTELVTPADLRRLAARIP